EPRRQAAALPQDHADAPLALAEAVDVGGVDEVQLGLVEERPHGRERVRLRDRVGEGLRHVAERGAAEADRVYLQTGPAELTRSEQVGHVVTSGLSAISYQPGGGLIADSQRLI